MKYKLVGTHAEDLDDGRVVNPGEIFEMDNRREEENPHNQRLVDEGLVIEVSEKEAQAAEEHLASLNETTEDEEDAVDEEGDA